MVAITTNNDQKILIAGAGVAGAALAQVFRKNNVPFEIFDREECLNARRGGVFRIGNGLEALQTILPDDLGDPRVASTNYNIGEIDTLCLIDVRKNTMALKSKPIDYGQPGYCMSARRGDFREWMCQHLPIEWNKRVSKYEEDCDGVTVYFTDGTQKRGSMLIGADGSNSVIRNQMLDNPPKEINPHVPIVGEVDLPRHAYLPLTQCGNGSVVATIEECSVNLMRVSITPDGSSARYWWTCSFTSEDPKADTAWVQAASPESLYKKALEVSTKLPNIMTDPLRRTGPSGIWQPQIRFTEWIPPKALPRGRVTLMGDAAHNTTPFGGAGCNTGLLDAFDLANLINQHIEDYGSIRHRGDVDWILKRYEDKMLPRGKWLVESSREAIMNAENHVKCAARHPIMQRVDEPLMTEFAMAPSPPMSEC